MPCDKCNSEIKQYERYYRSDGIVNQFLCKICGKCSYCHLDVSLSHPLEWDKDTYDIALNTINFTKKRDVEEDTLYTKDWR